MHDLAVRAATALLVPSGLATLAMAFLLAPSPGVAQPVLAGHSHAVTAALGLALVAAGWWPRLRVPAAAFAALSKASLLVVALAAGEAARGLGGLLLGEALLLALLTACAVVLYRARRQEAQWDGSLAWRPEA